MELETKFREVYEADIDSKNCISCVKFEDFKNGRKTECCHKCVMEKDENRFGWKRYPNLEIIK
jgi:hypothetical protein